MEYKFFNLTLENGKFKLKTNAEIPDEAIKEIVKIFVSNVACGEYEVDIETKNY